MQSPSLHRNRLPAFMGGKVRLSFAGILTIGLLFIVFSPGAHSANAPVVGMAPAACAAELLKNGSFELPLQTPGASALDWTTDQWRPTASFARDDSTARSGASSVKITATELNDAWFLQELTVEPETHYMLTGWIKTENVSEGTGANLSLIGTWTHTPGVFGTNDWTHVSVRFNSGSSTRITIGARLGYWGGISKGTAWFDDLRLTPIKPDGTHPSWKILVLIYDKTDALLTDTSGVSHHMVAAMTPAEVEQATLAATQFVNTDIPALTSGNMNPELTIRYPDHVLSQLDPFGDKWWPSAANTARDLDPAFDSVIVIWDPRAVDQYTGVRYWIGAAAGLTPSMGLGQTYATIIIEATAYGHRNVFKHEWGHSILSYFDALDTAPKPTVVNHANVGQYVHWPTGDPYVWLDETDANPIPNSIYSNESGFTHDYYSGTTATADEPTRRLGITPEAWSYGGPITAPVGQSSIAPVITCSGDITVENEPGTCAARLTLRPPTVFDACDSNLIAVATRSDGADVDAPFSCGQTVVTWTVTNSANVTSSCQQVVIVKDEEPPTFIATLPSVTMMTGPDATSCGAFVADAALRGAASGLNPVVLDPIGDVRPGPSPGQEADIASVKSTYDMESLSFTVNFAGPISPPSATGLGLFGFIDIDTDQNPATGINSNANVFFTPRIPLGVDYSIDVFSEWVHPGIVDVISRRESRLTVVGRVPITFTETSLSVTVPLSVLGGDNGAVNYVAYFGVVSTTTDRAPNGPEPATSVPGPDVIAVDNCSELVLSRSGVPANNLFPVGETLITYTATDASGNLASATQTVTVVDNTAPIISNVSGNPSKLWPPNHDMVDVTVSYDATDNCGISETTLTVTSNEPADQKGVDWEVVDAHHVRLRAAKAAHSDERIYTITITAKDIHGNSSERNLIIGVARNNGNPRL